MEKVTALNANSMQIEGVHKVTYDDQTYLIGAESDDVSFSNSKEELIHKIVTMTAIGLHVDNDDTVKVAIGCPISEYRNDEKRKSYLDYILPSGGNRVEIFIDGKKSSSTSADLTSTGHSLHTDILTGSVALPSNAVKTS